MTLCTAWIRKTGENDELIFVTDSCLSAGERWPTGIKLFDLPRKDALICFAGRTDRAYPLILNLISALQYNKEFQDKSKDVSDLALFVSELFTDLVYLISENSEPVDQLRAEANFLFGGWSWKLQEFVLFKIYYDPTEQKFVFNDSLADLRKKSKQVVFIGDHLDEAKQLLNREFEGDNSDNLADMEPLKVLSIMSRDQERFSTIRGALQIAKVYKSGHNEFFGVMWPSIKGKPHFLGKEYKLFEKPEVRYFDPDTLVIHEMALPEYLDVISETLFGDYVSFVEKCYPSGKLTPTLSKSERKILLEVMKHAFYNSVVNDLQDPAINGQEEEAEQEEIEGPEMVEGVAEEFAVGANAMAAEVIPAVEVEEAQPEINTEENNGDDKQE
jgi:hypothetical protein